MKFRAQGYTYEWQPLDDMTMQEYAINAPLLMALSSIAVFGNRKEQRKAFDQVSQSIDGYIGDKARRHWRIEELKKSTK